MVTVFSRLMSNNMRKYLKSRYIKIKKLFTKFYVILDIFNNFTENTVLFRHVMFLIENKCIDYRSSCELLALA